MTVGGVMPLGWAVVLNVSVILMTAYTYRAYRFGHPAYGITLLALGLTVIFDIFFLAEVVLNA